MHIQPTKKTSTAISCHPKKHLLVVYLLLLSGLNTQGQNPALELEGNGLLTPRLTSEQRDAILTPEKGLMIYNLTMDCIEIYRGSGWYNLCNGGSFVSKPVNQVLGYREDDVAVQVKKTMDGGYAVAGYGVSPTGEADFCVIKLDGAGSVEWSKYYGGSQPDSAFSLDVTSDGGYIVAGSSKSSANRDVTEVNHGMSDYWVIKLDALGNITWDRLLGGAGNDMARSVKQTLDGGYIIAGVSFSSMSGDVTQANQGKGDFWVVKLDKDGNISWSELVGGSQSEEAFSVQQTFDGGFVVAGPTLSEWSMGGMMNDPFGYNFLVVKMDAAGQTSWISAIGSGYNDFARKVIQTIDGGYLVAGYHDDMVEPALLPANMYTGYVLRLHPDGTQDLGWGDLEFDGGGEDLFNDIIQSSDGSILLAGSSTSSANGDITPLNNGMQDSWILKLNSVGQIIWQRLLGGSSNEGANSICQTSDGGYIVAGYTDSSQKDDPVPNSNGGLDYWIIKLNNFGEFQE